MVIGYSGPRNSDQALSSDQTNQETLITSKKRRQYSSEFKAKVAFAALKAGETTSALAARFGVPPSMVIQRKLLDNAAGLFEGSSGKAAQKSQEEIDTLYREIGKLTVERDFLSRRLER